MISNNQPILALSLNLSHLKKHNNLKVVVLVTKKNTTGRPLKKMLLVELIIGLDRCSMQCSVNQYFAAAKTQMRTLLIRRRISKIASPALVKGNKIEAFSKNKTKI